MCLVLLHTDIAFWLQEEGPLRKNNDSHELVRGLLVISLKGLIFSTSSKIPRQVTHPTHGSLDGTLTNKEINTLQKEVHDQSTEELAVSARE
jgi:hypothetical protein